MLVVASLNQKDGVGKTTVALGVAGAAQQHGVRTLVMDLDPQANATVALDVGPTTATVADVLDEPRRSVLQRAIAPSGWGGGLDVLVGAELTERHTHPDPGSTQLGRLARPLHRLGAPGGEPGAGGAGAAAPGSNQPADDGAAPGDPYRLGVFDCPPSLGRLTRGALAAAHRAVLVTDPTVFAVSGVQRASDAAQTEQQRGHTELQALGVLINRVRPRSSEHSARIAELRELSGPLVLNGVLPDRSAIQQAQRACLPIQRWDTLGAREGSAVFTVLLGRVLRSERPPRTRAVATAPPATR